MCTSRWGAYMPLLYFYLIGIRPKEISIRPHPAQFFIRIRPLACVARDNKRHKRVGEHRRTAYIREQIGSPPLLASDMKNKRSLPIIFFLCFLFYR